MCSSNFFNIPPTWFFSARPGIVLLYLAALIMAGNISAANVRGIADPRLGPEADVIGTAGEHPEPGFHCSLSTIYENPEGHDLPAPVLHGPGSIYLDRGITFENYHYWANRSREAEKNIPTDNTGFSQVGRLMIGKKPQGTQPPSSLSKVRITDEKTAGTKARPDSSRSTDKSEDAADNWEVTESEWEQAQRAARTATWGSVFYLITTDILGPTNVPWAISRMGYGPGVIIYTIFGAMACYSGLQLWRIFVGLDSTRFPMRNYGDVAFRVFGNWARILVNILQSFQFFLNVALLITSNGQGLAQMAAGQNGNGFLCFIVAELIFMLIGFVLGQIRTLQRLSFLANVAIWLNVVVIIMTMVVVHRYPPNYEAVQASYPTITKGPVKTSGYWPSSSTLNDKVTAMMNGVFAYGGATLFNELMAEMRRPYDFWKGFICAEIFIYSCYLIMGLVVYSAQGQFAFNPAYQGTSLLRIHFRNPVLMLNQVSPTQPTASKH